MTVTPDDVVEAAARCRAALVGAVDGDWSGSAGDLEWSCARTVEHMGNATLRYATHLASRATEPLPRLRRHDPDLGHGELLVLVQAGAATLAETARAAPASARAYHPAGMADAEGFLAMGCDEILVHTYDVARGLDLEVEPASDLAARVVARLFPWAPTDGDPWETLLWANGRAALPGHKRLDADWHWQCAPLAEWDGMSKKRKAPGRW